MADFQLVDDNQQFVELCDSWSHMPVIAVDTEFVRTSTYFPLLGLVQVCDGEQQYLIDPLKVDLTPFKAVLTSDEVIKVFHACQEDIEILHRVLDITVNKVFDTQVAAALLNYGKSIGYGGLVEACFNVSLAKEETQSNWMHRPLNSAQLSYAADDVSYLYKLFYYLKPKLEHFGRFAWVIEDSHLRMLESLPHADADYYLKIRKAWQLKGQKLWLLQALCIWRERLAKLVDVPRGRIVKDNELYEIARAMPATKSQMFRIKGLHAGFIKKHNEEVLQLIEKARRVGRNDFPERILGPLPAALAAVYKKGKECVEIRANELDIPEEALARKKQLEALYRTGMISGDFILIPPFDGWRKQVIGEELIELFKNYQ